MEDMCLQERLALLPQSIGGRSSCHPRGMRVKFATRAMGLRAPPTWRLHVPQESKVVEVVLKTFWQKNLKERLGKHAFEI